MRIKIRLLAILLLTLVFGFTSAKSSFADTYTVTGTVKDNSGTVVQGATITVNDANNDTTTTDGSGSYTLSVPVGTYNVQVTPPSGSNLSSAIAYNQNVSLGGLTLNFILTPSGSVKLEGILTDSSGNKLVNQTIYLQASGGVQHPTTTDQNGYYALTVSPGTYLLHITDTNNSLTLSAPQYYDLAVPSFSLTEDTLLNLRLPTKKVSVHVQDNTGASVVGAEVDAVTQYNNPITGLPVGGEFTGNGKSFYGYSTKGPITDSSGNVTLWVFPNDTNTNYIFTAKPPSGSTVVTTTLPNQVITGDTNLTVTMQQAVKLQGLLTDSSGTKLTNQTIYLQSSAGQQATTTTDINGNYTLSVAPGTYLLGLSANSNSLSLNAPQYYTLVAPGFSLTTGTSYNIQLPTKKVTVHVQDSSGASITGAEVAAVTQYSNPITGLPVGSGYTGNGRSFYGYNTKGPLTDVNGNVALWLFPNDSNTNYIFTVKPPAGSTYQTATLSNQIITDDTNLAVTMLRPVKLQGTVSDSSGTPLVNQTVYLQVSDGTQKTTTTDTNGYYSFSVTSGTYVLHVTNIDNNLTLNAPQYYDLAIPNVALSTDTSYNIQLPTKKVLVHVQSPIGGAMSGVEIDAVTQNNNPVTGLEVGGGYLGNGQSFYGFNSAGPVTDQNGNVTLWLFPNDANTNYVFTAKPPSGSNYNTFTLNNVQVTSDQTELVALQYNHATPVTTAALSPSPFADGTYSDPTTVTLSASAAAGYTVPDGNTYYTIDGGAQQIYTAPFTVTGSGNHTITYWSVDSAGVPEAPNTKIFTIAAFTLSGTVYNDDNQNGFQDTGELGYQGATVTLNTGQSMTTDANGTYTFTNLQPGTYTETLSVPQGFSATTSNPTTIALSANTTQNFGLYSAPVVGAIATAPNPVQINTAVSTSATFTDGDTTDTHTAIWNWGDGTTSSGTVTEPNGSTSGSVTGTHTYTTAGVYTVTLTVSDDDGASGTATYQYVSVYNPTSQGLFSAGQHFSSPAGAYSQNQALTGTVRFGLSYKYQGSVPVGDKQFTMIFDQANLTFNATTTSSLVTANGIGTLTGTGTINGAGTYNYLVTGDENANTIRIKITDQSGNVIYDTQPGAAADAEPSTSVTGNVIVH